MQRLGYDRYGAVGNDAGSMISPELGRIDPEHVSGVHVTQIFSFPSGDPAEFADLPPDDLAALQKLQWFLENKFAFNQLHSQQPQTLAHALADSPVGLLGWNWCCWAPMRCAVLDDDFVLTNVAIYWLTRTAGSSIRFYYEDAKAEPPTGPTTVPIGLATFAGDFGGDPPLRRTRPHQHRAVAHLRPARRPLRRPPRHRRPRKRHRPVLRPTALTVTAVLLTLGGDYASSTGSDAAKEARPPSSRCECRTASSATKPMRGRRWPSSARMRS